MLCNGPDRICSIEVVKPLGKVSILQLAVIYFRELRASSKF
uniref:Uncharacterized protein n=1 Tax=Anguilla anguilla TaxID=7936 RepID=A0A0E9UWP9_ANGAN